MEVSEQQKLILSQRPLWELPLPTFIIRRLFWFNHAFIDFNITYPSLRCWRFCVIEINFEDPSKIDFMIFGVSFILYKIAYMTRCKFNFFINFNKISVDKMTSGKRKLTLSVSKIFSCYTDAYKMLIKWIKTQAITLICSKLLIKTW